MIFNAFDVIFDERKDDMPPGACRPSKKFEKTKKCKKRTLKRLYKNNMQKVVPQKVGKN